ncbi:hypothetical protein Droror1_Dr00013675 [Drosera rotundifolia]
MVRLDNSDNAGALVEAEVGSPGIFFLQSNDDGCAASTGDDAVLRSSNHRLGIAMATLMATGNAGISRRK